MRTRRIRNIIPGWRSAALALVSAILLVLAFPDFDLWYLAFIALVPLLFAVEREQASTTRSFLTGWLFGTVFFFGTCWWLAYAPIHYAGFWPPLAYSLIMIACIGAAVFPAIFAAILSILIRRFGPWAFLGAPFVWVFSEFARYWITGNNWNAIGYSQAFADVPPFAVARLIAEYGGVLLSSFCVVSFNCLFRSFSLLLQRPSRDFRHPGRLVSGYLLVITFGCLILGFFAVKYKIRVGENPVIAVQPNVPMSGLNYLQLEQLRARQFESAQVEIDNLSSTDRQRPTLVVLPESPMNFMYNDDRQFQQFVRDFTTRNNVSLLFNSAEPDKTNAKYFNSAVMIGPEGNEIAEYDKIYLLPFGEAVPVPLDSVLPGFVGNFSYGRNYQLLPVGDAKSGVMICFESHFGQLSRRYVQDGADVIIEMTNDGYLGPTPVLRQHLANAVFRAVETNRPVLRVTNVGITAYIDELGRVVNPAPTYTEATRVWYVMESDRSQTFYVKYGDWFAWLCSVVTIGILGWGMRRRGSVAEARTQ